ncbi:protein mesh-like [Crassostrea virginica]
MIFLQFENFVCIKGELAGASVCTAFASRHFNTSGTIEVRLNSIRTADVLINGELVDFDESVVHQFPGLFVMELETNQSSINTRRKELIVSFTVIGIAFKVIASDKVLNILPVVGNKSLAGAFRGLLGNFDENQDNELRIPSGEMLLQNSTLEEIYDGFGTIWRLTENISLFSYEPGKSYNDYQKLSFRPTFGLPSNPSPEVEELCGTDQECAFDYIVTASSNFAAETLYIAEIFNNSVEATNEIKSCEELPSVNGGVWNATNTIEGSSAVFSCYPGYQIEGISNIVTYANNSWGNFGNFSCILIERNTNTAIIPSACTTEGLSTTIQPTTSSTTDKTKTTQSSTTEKTSLTPEIHSSTTSILRKTLQQFDREFRKILPYLIGVVCMIFLLSIFVGFLLCKKIHKK